MDIRAATAEDVDAISRMLREASLPVDGVDAALDGFVVAHEAERVVGSAGVEPCGADGLLRSVVVDASHRGAGLAERLCRRAEDGARARGLGALFLLTTDADGYFARLGFAAVERGAVPDAVRATEEFSSLCPDTAVVMRKRL